jgi:arginyl-tRNA synthetase
MDFRTSIAALIESGLEKVFGSAALDAPSIAQSLEVPPDAALGDYAFPCFRLAKSLRKAPPAIADQLSGAVGAPFLSKIESDKATRTSTSTVVYSREVLSAAPPKARPTRRHRGRGPDGCIDSRPSTSQRFHIGHLSPT